MAGFFGDSVRLSGVFGDVAVNVSDDVGTDGGFHDVGEWECLGCVG